jgi:hypothetical protein
MLDASEISDIKTFLDEKIDEFNNIEKNPEKYKEGPGQQLNQPLT